MSPEDWITGALAAKMVGATAVVALFVLVAGAWPHAIPIFHASRSGAMILARHICRVGLAITAAFLGMRKPSTIPVTLHAFPTILAVAAVFFCSSWYTEQAEDLDFWAAIAFVAPAVGTFFACTLIRIGLSIRDSEPNS